MKIRFLLILFLAPIMLIAQEDESNSIFIRAGFSLASGTFTQTIENRLILVDANGNLVEVDRPQFIYKGVATGATALVGYNFRQTYIMAGVKNFVMTPDDINTNFTLNNLALPDPINYGLGTLRLEHDLFKSKLLYLSPMVAANYIFSFESTRDFMSVADQKFSYSAGATVGVEVKRFKFLLTPMFNKVPHNIDFIHNLYKDSGAEITIHVDLFSN